MAEARRFIVKGRVQGVFFRESTRRVAESLDLTGHAINLPDGDVEVLACGESAAIERLAEWLEDGPPMANVSEVVSEQAETADTGSFRTG